jgi:cytochrome P450
MTPEELAARRSMMDLDPPAHSRIRRLLSRGFTPRVVRAYENAFRLMTGEVLGEVLARGEFDLVEAVSKQVPVLWLCEHMGIPRHMSDRLIEWTDRMLVGDSDPDYWEDRSDPNCRFAPFGSPAGLEAFQYAARLAAERRVRPGDDMISRVLQAEPGGEPLTDIEFNNFFVVLMIAGQEASRHSISQGVLALMDHPDQVENLQEGKPGLMDRAVEEIIRWATPIYHFRRTATRDVKLGGQVIGKGDKVTIWYISANFDEEVFDDPYRFNVDRHPNPQVSFGKGGPHFCLGAALGRLQVKVAIEELLPRISDLRPAGPAERLQSNFIHGIKRMPVRVAGS